MTLLGSQLNMSDKKHRDIVSFYDMLMKAEKHKVIHTLCNDAKMYMRKQVEK